MSAWRVPTSFVLANAPRLLCLPGGSKSVSVLANAPRLLSLPGGSQPVLCSPTHHVCCVCLEDPNLFSCLLMHLVYMCLSEGSQFVFVLTNAPRLSWVGPNLFLCSLMHLVCSVCLVGPNLFCARQCTTSAMSAWRIQICSCAC